MIETNEIFVPTSTDSNNSVAIVDNKIILIV